MSRSTSEAAAHPPHDNFYTALVDDDAAELYDHAPCGYLSLMPDGTICKANQTFLSWTGYSRDELVARRRFSQLLAPGDRIFYETHFDPLLRMQGRAREIAFELILRDGSRLPVIASAVVKRDAADDPLLTRIALFDARERRSYERELVEERRRAEASEARALTLAQTLQASLLPPSIPQPAALEIGTTYHPAGDGSIVGGDFYDVLEQPDGSVLIAIGDVAGKGPAAAVLTSLVRHTIRTESLRGGSPGDVLRTVAEAFLRYHPDDYCTAMLAAIEPIPRRRATIATGGHALPLRRSACGTVERIGEHGQILGLLSQPAIRETDIDLNVDDVVVMYTDGVSDAKSGNELFGEERVSRILRDESLPPQELADAIAASAVAFQDGPTRDDIAVVAWKILGDPSPPSARRTTQSSG